MPFLTPARLEVAPCGRWRVLKRLVYEASCGARIVVPKGFMTDLASIPQVFHALIPVNGDHRPAAIVHDFLFVTQPYSRAKADRIFLQAMADCGVRWSQRWAMYLAVRAGGWLPWRKNARALAADPRAFLAGNGLGSLTPQKEIATCLSN